MWAVFATAAISLLTTSGLLLVKKSNAFADRNWWAGIALILLTVPVDLLALGDTSSNILYPVGVSSTILFNQLLASPILLPLPIEPRQLFANELPLYSEELALALEAPEP